MTEEARQNTAERDRPHYTTENSLHNANQFLEECHYVYVTDNTTQISSPELFSVCNGFGVNSIHTYIYIYIYIYVHLSLSPSICLSISLLLLPQPHPRASLSILVSLLRFSSLHLDNSLSIYLRMCSDLVLAVHFHEKSHWEGVSQPVRIVERRCSDSPFLDF